MYPEEHCGQALSQCLALTLKRPLANDLLPFISPLQWWWGVSEPAPALTSGLFHFRFENGSEFTSELEDGDDPAAYVTNLSYYHLVPFETDILD